jgi:Ser/Thr protein kinase RdoA (MazF antagonist)
MAQVSQDHAFALRIVREAWDLGAAVSRVEAVAQGHINQTYFVDAGDTRWVLQRLSPIFSPEVNLDIQAVTAVLASAGMCTPRLIPTRSGKLWTHDDDGHCWRLQTFIAGETVEQVDSTERAYQAGRLLGQFHDALKDLDYVFVQQRLGVHDTAKHIATLREALTFHDQHRLIREIRPLAETLIERTTGLSLPTALPDRIVHGDPKITNIIFSSEGEAVALVDLDTVARMALPLELGDALRSWCNSAAEDEAGYFQIDFFKQAMSGYFSETRSWLAQAELDAVGDSVELIASELATRFCADALNESYFGWDSSRYGSAAEHNLARARGQLALAKSIASQRPQISAALAR